MTWDIFVDFKNDFLVIKLGSFTEEFQ